MYELLSKEIPFYDEDDAVYIHNIVSQDLNLDDWQVWDDVSTEAKDLIMRLLDKNPLTRLSATEALDHSWFKQSKVDQPFKAKIL